MPREIRPGGRGPEGVDRRGLRVVEGGGLGRGRNPTDQDKRFTRLSMGRCPRHGAKLQIDGQKEGYVHVRCTLEHCEFTTWVQEGSRCHESLLAAGAPPEEEAR